MNLQPAAFSRQAATSNRGKHDAFLLVTRTRSHAAVHRTSRLSACFLWGANVRVYLSIIGKRLAGALFSHDWLL